MVSRAKGEYLEKTSFRRRAPGDRFAGRLCGQVQGLRPWRGPVVVHANTNTASTRGADARANTHTSADCNACADACADTNANSDARAKLHLRSSGVTAEFHLPGWKRRLLGQRQSL